jgi:hypothetical protein
MTRLVVLGPPGAGKTWLAARISRLLDLPFYDLDDLYWLPDWRRPSPAEWACIQEKITGGESWVVAGNYQPTVELRMPRADAAVIIDPGPADCVRRLITRSARIYLGQTELLPERLRLNGRPRAHTGLVRIAGIALRYRRDALPRTRSLAARYGVPVLELRRPVTPQEVVRRLGLTIGTDERL